MLFIVSFSKRFYTIKFRFLSMRRLCLVFTCFLFLVSFVSAYELEFYHSDHLGSPVVVTNEDAEVQWSSDYDVFGESVNEDGVGDLGYNQKEKDDTGLLYYGARYYNAETGRFITADTVKGIAGSLQSQNLYVYVQNNPMRFIDPTGNQRVNSEVINEAYDCTTFVRGAYGQYGSSKSGGIEADDVIRNLAKTGDFKAVAYVILSGSEPGRTVSLEAFAIESEADNYETYAYFDTNTNRGVIEIWQKQSMPHDVGRMFELFGGNLEIIAYPDKESRAEAMKTVSAGAPVLNTDFFASQRMHALMKGEGDQTIEAHVGYGVSMESDDIISRFNDPLIFAVPTTQRGESLASNAHSWAQRKANSPSVTSVWGGFGKYIYHYNGGRTSVAEYMTN